jgi:tetratricopeptide (TPR) repeat protein
LAAASITPMKRLAACVWLAAAVSAEPVLLTFDGQGNLLRQGAAVIRRGGYAYVSRDALRGASSALVKDDRDAIHPVLWVTGDDPDAGVAEVWIGAQAPAGPDDAGRELKRARTASHEAQVKSSVDSGGFGIIYLLDCGSRHGVEDGPLYDEHGYLAGWHATRVVNGGNSSFGVPVSRLQEFQHDLRLTLEQWNRERGAFPDEHYRNGLAYLWSSDFEGALFYFRKAVQSAPGSARAWFHLAFVEGKTGHEKTKIECYRKAVELAPDFADAHYYLGFGLIMAGDRQGAEAELKRLKELKSPLAEKLEGFLRLLHVDPLPARRRSRPSEDPRRGRAQLEGAGGRELRGP